MTNTMRTKTLIYLERKGNKLVDTSGGDIESNKIGEPINLSVVKYEELNIGGFRTGKTTNYFILGSKPRREMVERANSYQVVKTGRFFPNSLSPHRLCWEANVQFYDANLSSYEENKGLFMGMGGTIFSLPDKHLFTLEELALTQEGVFSRKYGEIVKPERVLPLIVSVNSFELDALYPEEAEIDLLREKIDLGICEKSTKPPWANAYAIGNYSIIVSELGLSKKTPVLYLKV